MDKRRSLVTLKQKTTCWRPPFLWSGAFLLQECLYVSMLRGVPVQGRQLSCHSRQMLDSWRRQPQIAFCKDPINHPGTTSAIRYCSTRILGALHTNKDWNLWSVLGSTISCHGIVHGLKCVFCQSHQRQINNQRAVLLMMAPPCMDTLGPSNKH